MRFPDNVRYYMHRTFTSGTLGQIWYLLMMFSVMFIIGWLMLCWIYGFHDMITSDFIIKNVDYKILDRKPYELVIDNLFSSANTNEVTRDYQWIDMAMGLIGVCFMAVLTAVWSNYCSKISSNFINGLSHYHVENHFVIFGSCDLVSSLVKNLLEVNPKTYIIIQTMSNVDNFRKELYANLERKQHKYVIVYYGDKTSPTDLKYLNLPKVREIFIIGEKEETNISSDYLNSRETAHDATNMQCFENIWKSFKKKPAERISCRVMFDYQTTFSIFQFVDMIQEARDIMMFKPFNSDEIWAQRVLLNKSLHPKQTDDYKPLEGLVYDDSKFVHLVIAGMNSSAVALAIQTAQMCHYPNAVRRPGFNTRITFIDPNAKENMHRLMNHYTELFAVSKWRYVAKPESDYFDNSKGIYTSTADDKTWTNSLKNGSSPYSDKYLGDNFVDIDWEFIEGDLPDPHIRRYLDDTAADQKSILNIAICYNDADRALGTSINMPSAVYDSENTVQILVFQDKSDKLVNMIARENKNATNPNYKYSLLRAFGMIKDTFSYSMMMETERLAMKFSDRYYVEYLKTQEEMKKIYSEEAFRKFEESRKDIFVQGKSNSAKHWSNIYNANTIWTKLRSVHYSGKGGLTEEEKELLAKVEHNRWTMEQLLMNYRPLTEEEQKMVCEDMDYFTMNVKKEKLKGGKMAHLDICSFERLHEVDPYTVPYDQALMEMITDMIEEE